MSFAFTYVVRVALLHAVNLLCQSLLKAHLNTAIVCFLMVFTPVTVSMTLFDGLRRICNHC